MSEQKLVKISMPNQHNTASVNEIDVSDSDNNEISPDQIHKDISLRQD